MHETKCRPARTGLCVTVIPWCHGKKSAYRAKLHGHFQRDISYLLEILSLGLNSILSPAQTWLWPIPALGDFFFLSPLAILHPYRTAQYVKWETPSYVMATESSQGCSWVIRGDRQSTRVAEQTLWRSWFSTTVPPFFSLKRWLGNKPVTGASFSRFNYDS